MHTKSRGPALCIVRMSTVDLVGIWSAEASKNIYVLRKHPGLTMLSAVECGKEDEGNDSDDSDSDED